MDRDELPVAVIGAGPVGLAAAAQLLAHGQEPVVFEAGPGVGTSLLGWGHVRVFSPWRYNVDAAARALLERAGWVAPDPDDFPTGEEIVERYLAPLAALPDLRDRIRSNRRVVAVARLGLDKMTTPHREEAPFVVTTRDGGGVEETVLAQAVIDASGTYTAPNPLGAAGVPVPGERALADRIFYGIPDPLGADRARYAGRRVLVAGSGHSAMNTLLDLIALKREEPATEITWAVRREGRRLAHLYGGGDKDMLPERGKLGDRVRQAVAGEWVNLITGFKTERLRLTDDGIVVAGATEELPPVDQIVAATGFRPDFSFLSEIRLGLDAAVESPVALAPLIDPNVHSCGSVPPHGAEELRHPEPDFYLAGMKSYGRAPTFLMLTGYEQVRSVAAAIAGDWDAAREVRLELPQSGVCSTDFQVRKEGVAVATANGASCCGAPEPLIQIGAGPRGTGCCS